MAGRVNSFHRDCADSFQTNLLGIKLKFQMIYKTSSNEESFEDFELIYFLDIFF